MRATGVRVDDGGFAIDREIAGRPCNAPGDEAATLEATAVAAMLEATAVAAMLEATAVAAMHRCPANTQCDRSP